MPNDEQMQKSRLEHELSALRLFVPALLLGAVFVYGILGLLFSEAGPITWSPTRLLLSLDVAFLVITPIVFSVWRSLRRSTWTGRIFTELHVLALVIHVLPAAWGLVGYWFDRAPLLQDMSGHAAMSLSLFLAVGLATVCVFLLVQLFEKSFEFMRHAVAGRMKASES